MFVQIWLSCLLQKLAKCTKILFCILLKTITISHIIKRWHNVKKCMQNVGDEATLQVVLDPKMCMDEIWLFWVLLGRLPGIASWFWNMNCGVLYSLHSSVTNWNVGCDGLFWIVLYFSLLAWMFVCFSSQSQDSLCCMFFSVQVQCRSLFLTLEAEVWNFSHCWE